MSPIPWLHPVKLFGATPIFPLETPLLPSGNAIFVNNFILFHRGFGSNAVNNADYANEGIPVVLITTIEDGDDDGNDDEWSEILPLPASRYRYTKWHEIENVTVASSMLRAPRVRQGKNFCIVLYHAN